MTRSDALKRLRQCRDNQPDAMQILVAAEIVDALISTPCDRCNQGSWKDSNGIERRCTYCRGTGRVTA